MANSYTSLKVVMDKLLRHPMLSDLALETAVDYAIDFMRIVGSPAIFTEKVAIIEIDKYRGVLPCDFYEINQVRGEHRVFRHSTDSFHLSPEKGHKNGINDYVYKIQGNIIYTSIENGIIEIAYTAIEQDEDGFPIIPDNSKFTRALQSYIKKEWFTILFDLGKITPAVYQNTQQEYAWAVGACESEFQKMSLDKAESFFNSWRTLLVKDSEHSKGFVGNGSKQYLKI